MPKARRASLKEEIETLRREQILRAASRVMARKGFHRTRMQEVADAAGVSNGTVYNYFASKDELLLALLDRLNETEARPAQLESMRAAGTTKEALEALMTERFELWSSQKELARALLPVILADSKLRRRYLSEVIDPTFRLAEASFEKRGVRRPEALVRALAGSLFGLVVLDLLEDRKHESDAVSVSASASGEAIAILSELFAAGIEKRRGRA